MLIIRIMGGLGNQMQQYALYRSLLKNGADKEIKLDISWFQQLTEEQRADAGRELFFELPFFVKLPMAICTKEEKKALLERSRIGRTLAKISSKWDPVFHESKMFHEEIYQLKNRCLEGYFACQRYYDDIMEELQSLFCFPHHSEDELDQSNHRLIREMEQVESVSVHIRRGDYLNPINQKIYGNIATERYYESAMQYFRKKYKEVHFYLFTNDTDYVESIYKDQSQYTVVNNNKGKNSLLDMQLMSHCKDNICANSTFSLWGARLNRHKEKEIIRPLNMKNTEENDPGIIHDYWPGWIVMDSNGVIR